MRYGTLGASGLRVSSLGLGCSRLGTRLDATASEQLVKQALDAGITLFDTADVYGDGAGETALGLALGNRRDEAVVATKVRWATGSGTNDRGASRIHIRSAVEASLRRLNTDRIDLYQIHAPDPATPLEETVGVLDQLVSEGKILYAGTSNFAGWQVVDAHWEAYHYRRARLISTQAPYSLLQLEAERELIPAARRCGVGFIACLVLARGYLAGAFSRDTDPGRLDSRRRAYLTGQNRGRLAAIADFCADRGLSTAQLAIAAVTGHPDVASALVGAGSSEHLLDGVRAVDLKLTAAERAELFGLLRDADSSAS
ncbi:aldo/keto reductase [Streptomyces sp. NPDC040724]|uniref:aldo/keto reductase n=1 Tax=Streptomyces sp. NPDC040724 TaxID=3155612 RepID=UPI0033C7264B